MFTQPTSVLSAPPPLTNTTRPAYPSGPPLTTAARLPALPPRPPPHHAILSLQSVAAHVLHCPLCQLALAVPCTVTMGLRNNNAGPLLVQGCVPPILLAITDMYVWACGKLFRLPWRPLQPAVPERSVFSQLQCGSAPHPPAAAAITVVFGAYD